MTKESSKKKVPKRLRRSEAYSADPAAAQSWWDQGYRPKPAFKIRPDDMVLYRDTDIWRMSPVGDFKVGRVEWIKISQGDWQVEIMHTGCAHGDPATPDYYDEVWARAIDWQVKN